VHCVVTHNTLNSSQPANLCSLLSYHIPACSLDLRTVVHKQLFAGHLFMDNYSQNLFVTVTVVRGISFLSVMHTGS